MQLNCLHPLVAGVAWPHERMEIQVLHNLFCKSGCVWYKTFVKMITQGLQLHVSLCGAFPLNLMINIAQQRQCTKNNFKKISDVISFLECNPEWRVCPVTSKIYFSFILDWLATVICLNSNCWGGKMLVKTIIFDLSGEYNQIFNLYHRTTVHALDLHCRLPNVFWGST